MHIKIDAIAKWYDVFSKRALKVLGIRRDDWVQLWKNIRWNQKDNLQGNIRLGVEYLQLAVMLKRVIENYLQKEVLDIDEVINILGDDILKYEPSQMKQNGFSLRHFTLYI